MEDARSSFTTRDGSRIEIRDGDPLNNKPARAEFYGRQGEPLAIVEGLITEAQGADGKWYPAVRFELKYERQPVRQ